MERTSAVLGLLCVACACAGPPASPEPSLAGRVYEPARHRFVDAGEAERRVAAADIALLGETHDNAAHHEIQLRLLRAVVAAGKRPALALEQIDTEWQSAVDGAVAAGATPDSIARAGHVSAGWSWRLYAPLVAFALAERLPIVALNIPRESTRRIVRDGLAALGPGEEERLALAGTWNAARAAGMHAAIVEGHCGEASPMTDRLVDVQRARDAVMADRILARGAQGVVAILGRGHARADLAVPIYLAARAPARRVISVGIVEVDDDAHGVDGYPEAQPGRFDLVWFTPRARRSDPCAGFKGVAPR
jgi:uncharacterized iron-regulated protein